MHMGLLFPGIVPEQIGASHEVRVHQGARSMSMLACRHMTHAPPHQLSLHPKYKGEGCMQSLDISG